MAFPDHVPRPRASLYTAGGLVALVACIVLVDVLVPRSVHLGPLLVIAPALTAAVATPGVTAAAGLLAVVCQLVLGALREETGTSNTVVQAGALALLTVVLAFYSRSRRRREAKLGRVQSMAEAAGRALLREPPERLGPLCLATEYRAAGEEAQVGGDFYGVVRVRGGTRLLIGDVRGKGLQALDDTALVLGAFRAAAHLDLGLPDLAAHLDAALAWSNEEKGTEEEFATALLVDIPDTGDTLTALCCGHPAPYVLRDGGPQALESTRPAPPLGLGSLTPGAWTAERHPFLAGETLLLYTDGVIEARDRSGAFYPLSERLPRLGLARATADQVVRTVVDDLLRHTGGQLHDDAALLTAQRESAR
ncbi:PP2C family protein-serine/threonine phosphatase [Streptomyces sp. NPDC049954]|uniref:PP2C family protein-serine/threonine phosphatase n=1 Tax=Streptomyces sp. NPDC049954 TaxID=3155779 RepID=UPI003421CD3B